MSKFTHWTLHCRDLQRGPVTRIAVTNTTEAGRVQGVLSDGRRTSRPARECWGQYPSLAAAAEVELSVRTLRKSYLDKRERLSEQKEALRDAERSDLVDLLERNP